MARLSHRKMRSLFVCLHRIAFPLVLSATLKSLSSLLGDFFRDFDPGFLALDQDGEGTDGRDGRTEYSFTVLLGRRNTVLQYYLLFTIQFLKIQKSILGTL